MSLSRLMIENVFSSLLEVRDWHAVSDTHDASRRIVWNTTSAPFFSRNFSTVVEIASSLSKSSSKNTKSSMKKAKRKTLTSKLSQNEKDKASMLNTTLEENEDETTQNIGFFKG